MQVGDDPRPVVERLGLARACAAGATEARVERVELAARRRRTSAARRRRAPLRPRARAARRPRRAARPLRRRARAASRRRSGARSRSRRLPPRASRRRSPSTPGTKIAASFRIAARAGARRGRSRMRTRPASSRGIAGRGDQRARAEEDELPVRAARAARASRRGRRRARSGAARRRSSCCFARRREERRVDAGREHAVVAGEALLRRGARLVGERDQRVDARRAASRAASGPAGSRAGSVRRTSRRRARPCRAARDRRATAVPARSRGRRRSRPGASAWRRFAWTPTGTPSCERRETGIAGPSAITSAGSPRASARRPASRSAARVDGASTVTSWPERAQGGRHPGDVVVHVVRLRPRERRHQADAHRPRA